MTYEYKDIKGKKFTIPTHNKLVGIRPIRAGVKEDIITLVWSLNGKEVLRIKNVPFDMAQHYGRVFLPEEVPL